MLYKNKRHQKDVNLPGVFQRLGSSSTSNSYNSNNRQHQFNNDQRNVVRIARFDSSPQVLKRKKDSRPNNYSSLPDYSAISRMDNGVLFYSPNNDNNSNNNTYHLQQQQQQGFHGYSNLNQAPRQSFNFVKNEAPQDIKPVISFVRDKLNTSSNSNINGNFNYYQAQQQQQVHMNSGKNNDMMTSPTIISKNRNNVKENDHHHRQQQQQQQWHSNNSKGDHITVIEDEDESEDEIPQRYVSSSSSTPTNLDAIAKKIKIVTSLPPVEKGYDSDSNTTSSGEQDNTLIPTRKITVITPKRTRSTSRERSSVKKSRKTSISPPPHLSKRKRSTSSDRGDRKESSSLLATNRSHSRRRPRRRSVRNHDDSDEDLAPFLRLKADFYRPKYALSSSDDSDSEYEDSDKKNDINSRLSNAKKDSRSHLPLEFSTTTATHDSKSRTPQATTTTTTPAAVPATFKKELKSYHALGTSPPYNNGITSPSTTATTHNKVWINPIEKSVHKTSPGSIISSGPLPPSKKFTPSNKTAKATSSLKSTDSSKNATTTTTIKPSTPLSHKILTASNTVVPPKKPASSKNLAPSLDKLSNGTTSSTTNNNNNKNLLQKNNTLSNRSSTTASNTSANNNAVKNGVHKSSDKNKATKVENSISSDKNVAIATNGVASAPIVSEQGPSSTIANKNTSTVKNSQTAMKDAPTIQDSPCATQQQDETIASSDVSSSISQIEKRNKKAKELLGQLEIDDRDDVVMDIVPATTTNGHNMNKVVLKNKNCPQKTIEINLKQEPTEASEENDLTNQKSNDSTSLVSPEENFQQAFKKAWDSVSQLNNQLLNENRENDLTSSSSNINITTTTHADITDTTTAATPSSLLLPIFTKVRSPSAMDLKERFRDAKTPPPIINTQPQEQEIILNQDNLQLVSPPISSTQDKYFTIQLPVTTSSQQQDTNNDNNTNTTSTRNNTNDKSTTSSSKRKKSRVRYPWKVQISYEGEISYLNQVTGETTTTRPVA